MNWNTLNLLSVAKDAGKIVGTLYALQEMIKPKTAMPGMEVVGRHFAVLIHFKS